MSRNEEHPGAKNASDLQRDPSIFVGDCRLTFRFHKMLHICLYRESLAAPSVAGLPIGRRA
jgi:hypothetical protein